MEAGRLQAKQEEFIAETGLNFRFLFALYAGSSGDTATANDCASYANTIGAEDFPVFADDARRIAQNTPMDQKSHPQICAISDEMVILECFSGHNTYEATLDKIREHAGL